MRFPTGQWVEIEYNVITDPGAMGTITFYEGALKIIIVGTHDCFYLWFDGNGGCPYGDQEPTYLSSETYYPRHPNNGTPCEGNPSCNGGASFGYGTGLDIYHARTERVYAWQCP